jgi:DNA-binding MarR family transcriptional regulator
MASGSRKRALELLHNYTKGEVFVLTYLHMTGRGALPSELSRSLCSSTARMSALLKALEKKGEIERGADGSGRRGVVSLTGAGRERAKTEVRGIDRALIRVFRDMGERDTAEFIRLSRRFLELLSSTVTEQRGRRETFTIGG